jgi:23S rRNA (cytosine1962-C5)-methyltransferase
MSRSVALGADSAARHALLVAPSFPSFRLLDMGRGRKLEAYGDYIVDRPEEQAMGSQRLTRAEWEAADAVFDGDAEDKAGRWRLRTEPFESFAMRWNDLGFLGRFTAFRHMGVFPEQAAHWTWIEQRLKAIKGRRPRVLNLFAYTGVASLVAARAGADVTHVDASKKAIGWARENQIEAGLGDAPIRWIMDDAVKFVQREARRNSRYDMVLLDPPKFGRGPNGETWNLFDDLPAHLADCIACLSEDADSLVLTAYAIRASFLALDDLARPLLEARGGHVQSGELAIPISDGRLLSTSLFTRWSRT